MKYWLDTEFIERGPKYPIRLLSIGIVAEDGREYYYEHPDARVLVNEDFSVFGDRWLIDNVRPHLAKNGYAAFGLDQPEYDIPIFCDPKRYGPPEFWAYFADYDWVVFCQIFGRMVDLPEDWPMYCLDLKQTMKMLGVDREKLPAQEVEHSALEDARWTKRAWYAVHKLSAPPEDKL